MMSPVTHAEDFSRGTGSRGGRRHPPEIVIFDAMAIINEGLQYRILIDPFLDRVHSRAAGMIEPGSSVLDVACGNGTLTLKMAARAGNVTGIDISEGSLRYAKRRAGKQGFEDIVFRQMDARDLSEYPDLTFDVATISMAIHQFSPETGLHILSRLTRIARSVIVIDYAFPQPANAAGTMVRMIERLAGKEHFSHFNAYLRSRGMHGILEVLGLETLEKFESRSGVFVVLRLKKGR